MTANGAKPPGSTRSKPERTDWSDDIDKRRFSAWRVSVGERLQWLHVLLNDHPRPVPAGILTAMEIARRSARARTSPATWYSGVNIERAWRYIHLAETWTISRSPDLPGRLPAIRERVAADLGEKDRRVKALEAIKPTREPTASDRAAVAEALQAHFAASDNAHTAVRSLRNRLVLFGLLMLGLNLILGALSLWRPHMLPLCVKDFCATTEAISNSAAGPTGGDVWLIQLLGALGGAIAVVVLLLRTKPSVVAYTLTPYQATIKIMLGAVLAVVGVLIAGTGALQDVIAHREALLVFALVLGYAQQVGTRALDNFANSVVGKAQPKAGEG